ncbi:MAG: hypothetical protein AAGD43_31940 [Pseudomonadota bacterium]
MAYSVVLLSFVLTPGIAMAANEPRFDWEEQPWKTWHTQQQSQHQLVGRVWSARDQSFITFDELARRLLLTPFVLIGTDLHHADHHRLAAWMIKPKIQRRPVRDRALYEWIVLGWLRSGAQRAMREFNEAHMEAVGERAKTMISDPIANSPTRGQFEKLFVRAMRYETFHGLDKLASGLKPYLIEDIRWDVYKPTIQAAYLATLNRLMPGQDSEKYAEDFAANWNRIGQRPFRFRRWKHKKLDQPLSRQLRDGLMVEIERDHCVRGSLSDRNRLYRVRRYHDATAAYNMIDSWFPPEKRIGKAAIIKDEDYSVFYVGENDRVRLDYGIPWYLEKMVGRSKLVVVSMKQVRKGINAPHQYINIGPQNSAVADYMVFTPQVSTNGSQGKC